MHASNWCRLILLLILSLAGASGQSKSAEISWMEAAQADLRAARDSIIANTPGTVAGVDAEFLQTLDRAYSLAGKDAAKAVTYQGYRASLERFANTFQDDHVWMDFKDRPERQWPGFFAAYRGGQFWVASAADESRKIANARIVSCDGVQMSDLTRQYLQPYVARWSVPSARRLAAPYFFVDTGNPFVNRPERCAFEANGDTSTQELKWRLIAPAEYETALRTAQNIAPQPMGGVRAVTGGGYWLAIPTLNALNPNSLAALETMMQTIERSADLVRHAKFFVIDLRGNSGGNTFVAVRVLNAIWGERALARVRPRDLRAQWRASADNLSYLQNVVPVLDRLFGSASLPATGLKRILQGFRTAIEHNQPLYIDPDEYSVLDAQKDGSQHEVKAAPFVLTDGACISSCLNLVDLMLKLPHVVQVGDETGADSYYLENRPTPLPTGHAVLQFPMKLYANRERKDNASYTPSFKWAGQMADTAGLEAWISSIANTSYKDTKP